eukprot:scaffold396_cov127-Isochrysis_galbana.AAC.3
MRVPERDVQRVLGGHGLHPFEQVGAIATIDGRRPARGQSIAITVTRSDDDGAALACGAVVQPGPARRAVRGRGGAGCKDELKRRAANRGSVYGDDELKAGARLWPRRAVRDGVCAVGVVDDIRRHWPAVHST